MAELRATAISAVKRNLRSATIVGISRVSLADGDYIALSHFQPRASISASHPLSQLGDIGAAYALRTRMILRIGSNNWVHHVCG
jgi:hypothetical protein